MLFYKVEGIIKNKETIDDYRAQREENRKICLRTSGYHKEDRDGIFCFLADCEESVATVGIISEEFRDFRQELSQYLRHINFELDDIAFEEITLSGLESLLRRADRNSLVDDDSEILEKFGLDNICNDHDYRSLEFKENIVSLYQRENVLSRAEKLLFGKTLIPELNRIYTPAGCVHAGGHPVHYMIETDDNDTCKEVCGLLLGALYSNDRLFSRRYSFLDIKPGERFSDFKLDTLYRVSTGSAVIIRYLANDDRDSENASSDNDTIERLGNIIRRYRNKVLTVVCLPRECTLSKSLFFEHLGTISVVELTEEFAGRDRSRKYLKMIADSNGITPDKNLYSRLEEDGSYLAPQLHGIFDEWYDRKLKTSVYPQYRDIAVCRREVVKAPHKGSAYDELNEMIGLDGAKAVINKALNYFKVQKLYQEKGLKQENPSMHMVFTGNPGTAKTTVARLFARIMKDNGLLSTGQLVEVGRGDLVGKYVGWTAKIVQEKFKAAKGGVLFIDEAYSLVDDKSGLYGDEAINTIVQEMENHRRELVVIFAGYPDEMERFLNKNPGLRSRIAFHVPFADYNPGELCQIAKLMTGNNGLSLTDDAVAKLHSLFERAALTRDFGNGRYVRNILEQARMNQSTRLLEIDCDLITDEVLTTLTEEDIPEPEAKVEVCRRIGFSA